MNNDADQKPNEPLWPHVVNNIVRVLNNIVHGLFCLTIIYLIASCANGGLLK